MPRIARVVAPDTPHHLTQRGNKPTPPKQPRLRRPDRQDIFFTNGDRRVYLECLREESTRYGLRIMAYCLMTNHVHLLAIPRAAESLAKGLGRTHYAYTLMVNHLHGRSGHLWQNRFYSCPLDEGHYWAAARYVERNPVRAKMVDQAWEYPWSSASAHVGGQDPQRVLDLEGWPEPWTGASWQRELTNEEDEALVGRLRTNTHKGRPLGTDSFLSKLETLLNRRLRARPPGRPKRRQDNEPPRLRPRRRRNR